MSWDSDGARHEQRMTTTIQILLNRPLLCRCNRTEPARLLPRTAHASAQPLVAGQQDEGD